MPLSDAAPGAGPADGWIACDAPAKLNLFLKVVGRRDDGYHLLDSLVAFVSIGDRIRIRPAAELGFSVHGRFAGAVPSGPTADENLVVRAARRLAEAVGRPPDVAIELEKSLPAAAGLGGGSADAAATLRALATLWRIDKADPRVMALAARLGADVPVCLASRTCRMRGIGDKIEPAPPLTGLPILLVNPGVPVSTPEVFRAFSGAFSTPLDRFDPPREPLALARWLDGCGNDLQAPALSLAPAIGTAIEAVGEQTGCLSARMSGSGATCFGLFDTEDACAAAAARLQSAEPGWWVRDGRLI